MHTVISLRSRGEGTPRHAAMAAFTAVTTMKLAVIVDDDVDIFDGEQVEWAVATRMQADRDLFVVARTTGSSLDPPPMKARRPSCASTPPNLLGAARKFARMRSKPRALADHLAELAG